MRITKIVLITCLSCICASAYCEDTNEYKVEMILFSNIDSQSTSTERAQGVTLWPDLSNAAELSTDPAQADYQILSELDKGLSSIAAQLNRSSRYRVIAHLVWRQRMLARSSARPLHIHGGVDYSRQFSPRLQETNAQIDNAISYGTQSPPPLTQVDGTVNLFVGRYLHIHTDLIYRQPGVPSNANAEDDQVVDSNILIDYRVRNTRKMRSGELHYLDHPLLGILVEITPLEKSAQP
jgi:hypothetical protein